MRPALTPHDPKIRSNATRFFSDIRSRRPVESLSGFTALTREPVEGLTTVNCPRQWNDGSGGSDIKIRAIR